MDWFVPVASPSRGERGGRWLAYLPYFPRRAMKEGDNVRLNTPDNPRLHGTQAVVLEVTAWGAHVGAPAAATGRFRALTAEMVPEPVTTPSGDLCPSCGGLMVRTGTCLTCQFCGESSGGCS